MPVLRGKDNCFVVNIVEEWYKWWNFVTICVFCECGIEQRYYRSLSKMGYEWNGKKKEVELLFIV